MIDKNTNLVEAFVVGCVKVLVAVRQYFLTDITKGYIIGIGLSGYLGCLLLSFFAVNRGKSIR